MWNLKNNTNESILKSGNRLIDIENKLTVTKGERERGNDKEYGIHTAIHKIDKQQGFTV